MESVAKKWDTLGSREEWCLGLLARLDTHQEGKDGESRDIDLRGSYLGREFDEHGVSGVGWKSGETF